MYKQVVFFCTNQTIFLAIYIIREDRLLPLQHPVLYGSQSCQNFGTVTSWFVVSNSFRTALCVWTVPAYPFFEVFLQEPFGTVRSGDRTGYGTPDTYKFSSLLTNTLRNPPIHCRRTDFEMAWHMSFSMCRFCPLPPSPSYAKVSSEMCQLALCHSVCSPISAISHRSFVYLYTVFEELRG